MFIRSLLALTVTLTLSACTWSVQQRSWLDLQYPAETIAVEVIDQADMSKAQRETLNTKLQEALWAKNIRIDPKAERRLIVEVVKYREHPWALSALQWGLECTGVPMIAHYTMNAVNLRAKLVMPDGKIIQFAKFGEINESGREFEYLLESMTRRVAGAVFTADALADQG